jgi:hypothetical protein
MEHGLRGRSNAAEFGLAVQVFGDAGTDTAGFVGIDFGEFPYLVGRGLRVFVVRQEGAPED